MSVDQPPTLEADLLRIKRLYFEHGWLDCTIQLAQVQEDTQQHTVRLVIALNEGQRTRVTAVTLEGTLPADVPPVETLLAALPLRPEQPLTKAAFEQSKALLRTHLHNAGYARAQIVPQTVVDPEQHTATVTFTLVPGAQTVFGQIAIRGAQQVDESALRRHLPLHPGQRVSDQALSDSADALYNLGMFQAVTPRALNPDAVGEPLDVAFDVIERKPRSLQFSVGYSTAEGFRTEVQWAYRNLRRAAEQLTLSGRLSAFEQKTEARLLLPYFLAARTAFSALLFVRNEQEIDINPFGRLFGVRKEAQPAFDLLSIGTEARVEHRFTDTLTGLVGLGVSRNDFRRVNQEALTALEQEIAEDNILVTQLVEAQWNSTNSLLNPSRGLSVRGRLEHASTALFSDVNFVKLLFEVRHYLPVGWQVIVATRLKLGGIYPYANSTEVPFNVRFFAGGSGSVRGFALNRLGPVNQEGDPIGGMSLFEGGTELRFPLIGELGVVLFADFGNVFRAPFHYRFNALRYAVGPGLRYNTPVGPFRLDVGFIIEPRPSDDFGRIEFSIGQAF